MKLNALLLFSENLGTELVPEYAHIQFITMTLPSLDDVTRAFAAYQPILIMSVGEYEKFIYLCELPLGHRMVWIHVLCMTSFPTEDDLLFRHTKGLIDHDLELDHPLISVITTTFHSGKRIERPWQSLQCKTYDRWEWIVCDDSKDYETHTDLLRKAATDARVRVYRAPNHSGFIGGMKQMAAGLSRGKNGLWSWTTTIY